MQLPEESKKFDQIDKSFKMIMSATSKNPNVVDACTADNRLAVLNGLSDRLDNCQKSLSDYLDTKRCAFPRFFFISDDSIHFTPILIVFTFIVCKCVMTIELISK